MSKKAMYQVALQGTISEVSSIKEVSQILGFTVTKREVAEGTVEGVSIIEATNTMALHDPLTGEQTISEVGPSDRVEPLVDEDDTTETAMSNTVSEEDEAKIEEILSGSDELSDEDKDELEDTIEGEDTEEEPVYCAECGAELGEDDTKCLQPDGVTILCEGCNANVEEMYNTLTNPPVPDAVPVPDPTPAPTGKKSMAELLAELKAKNAAKALAEGKVDKKSSKRGKRIDAQAYVSENNGYPEVGFFKEEKDLKNFYKKLSDDQLDEWIDIEGLQYKESDNEPINRMRKCMAILYMHFPRESKTTASKKKSKYADYTTEDLLSMAIENDIYVKEAKGDERILRMYAIMELKKAGLLE